MKLTLVVEYGEGLDLDVLEGIKELIEKSREYGWPKSAILTGIPHAVDLNV